MTTSDAWPTLPFDEWKETCDALHLWSQMVGKVKLALCPFVNHWWHVTLRVSPRGLTSGAVPYARGIFSMTFDFHEDVLRIDTSEAKSARLRLAPRSVADFYREFTGTLHALGIDVTIWPVPVEMPDHRVRFDADDVRRPYDAQAARTFWRMLTLADKALNEFRSAFVGKCSPVHFFWGSFDLAVTRFSGRPAPVRPEFDRVMREAYSQEVSSAGFWPGGGAVAGPAFYSYTAPEPAAFPSANVRPDRAFYDKALNEFLFMWDDARTTSSPERALREFFDTTYGAGATAADWNRGALERDTAPHSFHISATSRAQ